LTQMYDLVLYLRQRLKDENLKNFIRCVAYGHIGDGNLHLNVTSRESDEKINNILEPFIFEWAQKHNGSISAEHGIGYFKAKYLHYSKAVSNIILMKKFKQLLDPNGIFNPYKVLA
jgi:FAD/FMN-containing dehydrogenase